MSKWFSSPLRFYEDKLSDIYKYIPTFERESWSPNKYLGVIKRQPLREDPRSVHIGVVSKNYTFIQHKDVVKVAEDAFKCIYIDPRDVRAELAITEYGERMAFTAYFPDNYQFDPGDRQPLLLYLALSEFWGR